MKFAIITENDESAWDDETGEKYHFPRRYRDILLPKTMVIYYKGRMTNKAFKDKRLSEGPHYFGKAEIGNVSIDPDSDKQDYYAEIENFELFPKPVSFRQDDTYLENIPITRSSNYWRDGVREVDEATYNKIIKLAGIHNDGVSIYNDDKIASPSLDSEFIEGGAVKRYTTVYERDSRARKQAVAIHGYNCMACGLNFEEKYGEWGQGFIHVHHTKPISTVEGKTTINPKTDLIVICANCHSMVHRRKDKVLTLEELKDIIK